MLFSSLNMLAIVVFGLFCGAMLLIGTSIVPYWQSLGPTAFREWFQANGNRFG